MRESYVYILANQRYGTLYVGLTSNLVKRIWEHKNKLIHGFTVKYNITQLVYYEIFDEISLAAARERVLKRWKRCWKIVLIEKTNPEWRDLYPEIIQ